MLYIIYYILYHYIYYYLYYYIYEMSLFYLLFRLKKNYFIQRKIFERFSRFEKLHIKKLWQNYKLISVELFSLIFGQFLCWKAVTFSFVKRYDLYILRELFFQRTDSRQSIISGSLLLCVEFKECHYLKMRMLTHNKLCSQY